MAQIVKVFTTPTWPHCTDVKEYLSQKGVSFKELDVTEDENARNEMYEKTGKMAVPVIDVDGEIIVGFNKQMLEKKLH